MSQRDDKPGAFIISAIACFVLAALLLGVGWWMFSALLAGQEDMERYAGSMPRRRRGGGSLMIFGVMGLIVMLGGLAMSGIGLMVIWKGIFGPKPKGEAEDNSWRNMPAPSDAPTNRRPIPPTKRR
jgi:hypothetical protein